ncbi:hypothetical protein B0H11DRAFT_2040973 [Mycena galericulata]|nr:hypothetical protein B0H11DRAFT_2040973 [Mycena galericulata]
MYNLTGSLFLSRVLKVLATPMAKVQLLQSYVRVAALFVILRGRPRIYIPLLMSYIEFPQPPLVSSENIQADKTAFRQPDEADGRNPWFPIIKNALHHTEPHLSKAARALYRSAQLYGHIRGAVPGAFDTKGVETHIGSAQVDGIIFIRAPWIICVSMGWVTHGQPA